MNLDALKLEIETALAEEGLAIFYGHTRALEPSEVVYWDVEHYPDYKLFLKAAKAAGSQLLVLHHHSLTSDQVDDVLDELEACDMPREEYRSIERKLQDLRVYEGFTCSIELSFDHGGRMYMMGFRSEWYRELLEIQGDLEILGGAGPDLDDEEDESGMGGYFSRN
ncbi:MAG TPA: hypothetical protein VKG25_24330 [Bryobacteraceae bacterium]|nr:hypothetical protein [Bryobacteraceae bacterium]